MPNLELTAEEALLLKEILQSDLGGFAHGDRRHRSSKLSRQAQKERGSHQANHRPFGENGLATH